MRQDPWGEKKRLGVWNLESRPNLLVLDIPNYRYLPYHFGVDHTEYVVKNGKIVYRRPDIIAVCGMRHLRIIRTYCSLN